MLLCDRKYHLPRMWSNRELKKFAHLFSGSVVNVSAWRDSDKEGGRYEDYFSNASSYSITNYGTASHGFQGLEGEIYLDLEGELAEELRGSFDVVFCHTVLEHVYDYQRAFANLCAMTRDVLILVVPFLQQMHSDYGDYWRFSPLALQKMFAGQGVQLLYLSFNNHPRTSVYVFCIGSKNPDRWASIANDFSYRCERAMLDDYEDFIGCRAIENSTLFKVAKLIATRVLGMSEYR
jgi:hypothetical protein